MDRPIFLDNRITNLVDLLSNKDRFFQALFRKEDAIDHPLIKTSFQHGDPDFLNFIVGIHNFISKGLSSRLEQSIYDFNVICRPALSGVVAQTSWTGLPVTYFIAGAYMLHHPGQSIADWSPDNMIIWFFVHYTARDNNDRFVTESQRRSLVGPSEYSSISLIVRLMWQAAHPNQRDTDSEAIAEWFKNEAGRIADIRFLDNVEITPRTHPSRDGEDMMNSAGRRFRLGEMVDFGQHGNAHNFKLPETWNVGEADFCWGKSPVALLAFNLEDRVGPATLDVDVILRESKTGNANRVAITCNGVKLCDLRDIGRGYHRLRVPIPGGLREGRYTNIIGFHAPFFRPSDYSGEDNRDLGTAVQRFRIYENL